MKKLIIIGAAVLLLGGGAAYLLTKGDDEPSNQNQTNTQTDTGSQSSTSGDFSPVSTQGLDFVATVTTTTKTGTSTAKFEQDGDKTRYTISANDVQSQFIYTKDAYYTCNGDQCFKYASSQSSNNGVNTEDYQYSASQLADFKNSATYQGKKDCPAGTCDVWSVTFTGSTSTIYIDTQTKRISQTESTIAGNSTKLTYDYQDVTVNIPTNARTFPTTP